jgi:hypothetical protein
VSQDQWVYFLTANSVFVAVLLLIALGWLWLLRRSSAFRGVAWAVGISAAFGVVLSMFTWLQQPPPPAGSPAFVLPWGGAMVAGMTAAFLALFALLLSSAVVGYRWLRTRR